MKTAVCRNTTISDAREGVLSGILSNNECGVIRGVVSGCSLTVDVVHRETVGEIGKVCFLSERSFLHFLRTPIIQTLHYRETGEGNQVRHGRQIINIIINTTQYIKNEVPKLGLSINYK